MATCKYTSSCTNNIFKQCSCHTTHFPVTEDHIKHHKFKHLLDLYPCTESALEPYICYQCLYKTPFIVDIRKHMQSHGTVAVKTRIYLKRTVSEKMQRSCKKCKFITYSRLVLLKHISDRCPASTQKPVPSEIQSNASTDDGKLFKCDRCPYRTESNIFFTMHMSAEHNSSFKVKDIVEDVNISVFEEINLPTYEQENDNVKYVDREDDLETLCRFCMYQGEDLEDLRRHFMEEHTKNNEIKCGRCEFKTQGKRNLEIHVRMIHNTKIDNRWHRCGYCPFKTKKLWCLERHLWKKEHGRKVNG